MEHVEIHKHMKESKLITILCFGNYYVVVRFVFVPLGANKICFIDLFELCVFHLFCYKLVL